jgi:hypothetical protein
LEDARAKRIVDDMTKDIDAARLGIYLWGMKNTIADPATLAHALAVIPNRATYQRNLILGYESLSGASLRGKARKWFSKYAASRASCLARLRRAGIAVREVRGAHGKRILVLGTGIVMTDTGASCLGAC